jgi:hypothetical protein
LSKDIFEFENTVEMHNRITRSRMGTVEEKKVRHVQVMIEFLRIGQIDNMGEKYDAEINFEATWTENEMITNYDPNVYWNPMIYVENLLIKHTSAITYSLRQSDEATIITEIHNIKG